MSKAKKILNIFLDPVSVFKQLREQKDWVFPLVIIIAVSIISTILLIPILSSPQYIAELEQDIGETMGEEMESYMMIGTLVGSVVGGLITILGYLLLGFFLWLIGKFADKEYTFTHTFSAATYVGIVGSLGTLLYTLLANLQFDLEAQINLALIFPNIEGLMGTIVENFNIFGFWQAILVALAISVFYQVKKRNSLLFILGLWVLINIGQYLIFINLY